MEFPSIYIYIYIKKGLEELHLIERLRYQNLILARLLGLRSWMSEVPLTEFSIIV